MREKIFKGKRLDNGQWVKGCLIIDYITGQYFIHADGFSVNESDKVNEEGCLKFLAFEIDPETVCEYTSKTDRNGNEIFEGDIVAFYYGHNKDICEVVFENGAFGLGVGISKKFDYDELETSVYNATENYDNFVGCDNFISLWEIAWNYNEYIDENLHLIEVIGNKYDNPELLED